MEGTFFKKLSDRDMNNEKLMSRYMVAQTNCNPFMANNDYLKDLEVQDNFLTPQNSGQSAQRIINIMLSVLKNLNS